MIDLNVLKAKYKALTPQALKQVRGEYHSLLQSTGTSETEMHAFLTRNSYLLPDRYHVDLIVSKPKCVSCVLDFGMYENTGNYSNWHFLEIKSPNAPVIVKKRGYPCLSSVVTEAVGQVKQFKTELDSCQGLMIQRFPFVRFSFYSIIVGRSADLQAADRDFLKDINQSMAEIHVRTYDSIGHYLDRLIKNGSLSLRLVEALTFTEYLRIAKSRDLFYACAAGDVDAILKLLGSRESSGTGRGLSDSWPMMHSFHSDVAVVSQRGRSLLMTLRDVESGCLSSDVVDPLTLVGTPDLRALLDAKLVERTGEQGIKLTRVGKELLDEFRS
jgi:hypothetical protein